MHLGVLSREKKISPAAPSEDFKQSSLYNIHSSEQSLSSRRSLLPSSASNFYPAINTNLEGQIIC